jgi:glycine/D-amino acid oxidase-like deaminating enzyme
MKIKHLPLDQNINGWAALRGITPRHPGLHGKVTADWLVIGAGFAGLAFARRIAELRPHEDVVVLEALDVADNASARNSGFVIDLPHTVGSTSAELEQAHTYRRLLQYGLQHLKDTVDQHGIACDWHTADKHVTLKVC